MLRSLFACCCFWCIVYTNLYGQTVPADGASLNYTQVMLEQAAYTNAAYYKLLITPIDKKGIADTAHTLKLRSPSPAVLVKDGLEFGKKYQWQYEVYFTTGNFIRSRIFNFSIAASSQTDSNTYCFSITKKIKAAVSDDVIFFDNPAVAINRDGKVVWYMPLDSAGTRAKEKIRNLHITPFGTLLYLSQNGIAEKSIDGKLLWKGPEYTGTAGVGKDVYHHDCLMLADGTYLVCDYDYENEPCAFSPADTCQVRYNTVLQMDKTGKILWKWNEKGQVDPEDIYPNKNSAIRKTEGSHMNGFGYDAATKSLLFSFRNNSRIIKVNKETGKLLWNLKPGMDNIFYTNQHGIVFTKAGEILFYNNEGGERQETNSGKERKGGWPVIMILKEVEKNKRPIKVWEYECATPAYKEGLKGKEGYATELPNSNILVCMGSANRSFEITRQKKIVWESFYEQYDSLKNSWLPITSYRCHAASSLFPYYFTLQKTTDLAGSQIVSFQLFNNGSNDDTYTITLDTQKGYFKKAVQVIAIKAGESKQVSVVFLKNELSKNAKLKKPSQVIIHVDPNNSSIAKRSIYFDWKL